MKYGLYFLISTILLCSCGNKFAEQESKWQHELDSINGVNKQKQSIIDGMTSTIVEVSIGLDSITRMERIIISGIDETGAPITRRGMKVRLEALSNLIKEQKAHMMMLEQDSSEKKAAIEELKSIIVFLNATLEEKNAEIEKLQQELNNKNFNIKKLISKLTDMTDTISSVRQENDEQRQMIDEQMSSLNVAYYIVGTKQQLVNWGILSKPNILGQSKILYSSIDKSVLNKVDIRHFKTLQIEGKHPKILSSIPKESYSINESGVLTINNIDSFWSGNNKILIVQVK